MSVLSAEIGAVSSTMSEQAQPNQSDTTCSEKYWAERVRRYKEVFKINVSPLLCPTMISVKAVSKLTVYCTAILYF